MPYVESLAALADPNRRALVEKLSNGPQNVARLAVGFPISRPAVSQHLKVLCDAGLLSVRAQGNRRVYSLCPDGAKDLHQYLDRLWGDALAAYEQHVRKEIEND